MFRMNAYPRRAMAAVLAGSLVLSGCANNPISDAMLLSEDPEPWWSEEQVELLEKSQESAEIRLAAGGVGAVVGAGLSLAFCEDIICNLAVTAAFTTLAYAGGAYVASKREYAEAEQSELRNSLDGAESAVAFYEERVALSQKVVDQHDSKIAALNQQDLSDAATREEYERQYQDLLTDRARIEAFADQVEGDIAFMEREMEVRRQGGEDVTALENKRDTLQDTNKELRDQVAELDRIRDSVPEAVAGA